MNRDGLMDTLLALAKTAFGLERELCGFIGVYENVEDEELRWQLYPLTNTAPIGRSYSTDPIEQVGVFREMQASGIRLWGVYHTHSIDARPSEDDEKWWRYPMTLKQVIAAPNEVRAWDYRGGDTLYEVSIP